MEIKINSDIDITKTNKTNTRRRIMKSWEHIEEPLIDTGTEDNIDRAGFLSIEEQYEAFKRAGINAVERLKAIYPETKYIENEEDLLKNKDIVKMAESGIREPLDAIDRQMKIETKIKEGNEQLKKLQKENKELQENIKQQELLDNAKKEAIKQAQQKE
jgi:hypothetical protein